MTTSISKTDMDSAIAALKKEGEERAVIVANTVCIFAPDVPASVAEDVLDGMRLMNLSANKKFDKETQQREWYNFYNDGLGKFGWTLTGAAHVEEALDKDTHTLATLAPEIVTVQIGRSHRLSRCVKRSFEVIVATPKAQRLLEESSVSVSGKSSTVQISACEMSPQWAASHAHDQRSAELRQSRKGGRFRWPHHRQVEHSRLSGRATRLVQRSPLRSHARSRQAEAGQPGARHPGTRHLTWTWRRPAAPGVLLAHSPKARIMPAKPAAQRYEDLHACLRLAQLQANAVHDRQQDGQRWLSRFLLTLEDCGAKLLERTTRNITYVPTDAVFEDVFAGWIPSPQKPNLMFKRVASDILHGLKQPDLALLRSTSASSHMNIAFDVDDDGEPAAIVFHLWCVTDPDAPRTRLVLQLNHLGVKLDTQAFEARRDQVESRLREYSNLDQF